MGIFSKLFAKSDKAIPDGNQELHPKETPCKTEQELIERYGGIALDKQIDFGEIIGNNNWNVDMQQGIISFGLNLVFPIQVLGTIAHSSQTWLWAWANTMSGLPPQFNRTIPPAQKIRRGQWHQPFKRPYLSFYKRSITLTWNDSIRHVSFKWLLHCRLRTRRNACYH